MWDSYLRMVLDGYSTVVLQAGLVHISGRVGGAMLLNRVEDM